LVQWGAFNWIPSAVLSHQAIIALLPVGFPARLGAVSGLQCFESLPAKLAGSLAQFASAAVCGHAYVLIVSDPKDNAHWRVV
jgi:hypothetical protein